MPINTELLLDYFFDLAIPKACIHLNSLINLYASTTGS